MERSKALAVFKNVMPLILFSGCAISKQTYLPDRSEGYSISCDGAAGMNVCFEKAGQLC